MNRELMKGRTPGCPREQPAKVSEPDVRAPQQLATAPEASSAVSRLRNERQTNYFTPSINHAGRAEDSPAKVDTGS
jgi:hypothetical protein